MRIWISVPVGSCLDGALCVCVCVVRLWCLICCFGSQSDLDQYEVSRNSVQHDVSSLLFKKSSVGWTFNAILERSDFYYKWMFTAGVNVDEINCVVYLNLVKQITILLWAGLVLVCILIIADRSKQKVCAMWTARLRCVHVKTHSRREWISSACRRCMVRYGTHASMGAPKNASPVSPEGHAPKSYLHPPEQPPLVDGLIYLFILKLNFV